MHWVSVLILGLSWLSVPALYGLLRDPRHPAHKSLPTPDVVWLEPEAIEPDAPAFPDFRGFT